MSKKLSIIIPAYNEENTILALLEKVLEVNLIGNLSKELVIVNDCSTDKTEDVVLKFKENHQRKSDFEHRQIDNDEPNMNRNLIRVGQSLFGVYAQVSYAHMCT